MNDDPHHLTITKCISISNTFRAVIEETEPKARMVKAVDQFTEILIMLKVSEMR